MFVLLTMAPGIQHTVPISDNTIGTPRGLRGRERKTAVKTAEKQEMANKTKANIHNHNNNIITLNTLEIKTN